MEAIVRPPLTRVVLTGSESVGKTTLAHELAAHYGVECVPEFVREYAAALGRPIHERDHEPIAHGQMAREDACMARATTLLIQDTDPLSTVVYAHHYIGRCAASIEEARRAPSAVAVPVARHRRAMGGRRRSRPRRSARGGATALCLTR